MYTQYTCIYTIYTPLNTSIHPKYTTTRQARAALDSIVGHPSLEGIPLLIMANKQDRADAREVDEMEEVLAVGAIQTSGRACRTQPVSALTCEGIEEGVVWLIEAVKKGGLVNHSTQQPGGGGRRR